MDKENEATTTQYIPRETLRRVSTPQAYKFDLLDRKYHEAFEKEIYCAFIEKETVKGDVVEFKTTFGVTLTTVGNRRTLNSFRGFKRCNMDGTVEYVDAPYKVYGFSIQYRRYLTMAAKRERKDAV